MKHIFFLILTTLAYIECKTGEKAEDHNLFCYVRYDEAQRIVKAEATMQDLTLKKPVEIAGGIRYQGMDMSLTPLVGLSYRYEYAGDFMPEHVFSWNDKKSGKQEFKMQIDPIGLFSFQAPEISQSTPNTLKWKGKALGNNETLVFIWENTEAGKTVPMEVRTTNTLPLIEIPAAKLEEITPGNWTLYLVRKKMIASEVNRLPVNAVFEYYTKSIPVKVLK